MDMNGMQGRFGPIVIFTCKFCDWEKESPWVYSHWPPLDFEEYELWKEMVNQYEEDSHVDAVCPKCQRLGLTLDIFGLPEKKYPVMERV